MSSHTLPNRALTLIHDYSKPLTKPDWRGSKPIISIYRLYLYIRSKNLDYSDQSSSDIHLRILWQIQDTDWYFAYGYVKYYGLNRYLFMQQETNEKTYMDDGIQDAQYIYTKKNITNSY
jgi:hypothetical protein